VDSPEKAFQGGRAFGRFQRFLDDLNAEALIETIPDFHNIESRLASFRETVEKNPVGRKKDVEKEIAFIEKRADEMKTILILGREGNIPLRITHNDTKFNNVLLDRNDRALCVIDLDTVMPGFVHYDFGDAIRTGASTAAEDEEDLSKVSIDPDLFRGFARGFLEQTGEILNRTEIDHLAFSARFMTCIIGLRFLSDHIDGDNYFKIHHSNHNLQRARAQFRLLETMEENREKMQKIIEEAVPSS